MNCEICQKLKDFERNMLVKRGLITEKMFSEKSMKTNPLVVPGHMKHTQNSIQSSLTLSTSTTKLNSLSCSMMMRNVQSLSSMKLWWLLCSILLTATVLQCGAEDVAIQTSVETVDADKYLSKFGYYPHPAQSYDQTRAAAPSIPAPDTAVKTHTDTERRHAIELLQEFFHLPVNGQLDKQTTTIMKTARCGWKDVDVTNGEEESTGADGLQTGSRRVKRYSLNKYGDGSYAGWKDISELTWKITRPSRQIPESQQKEIIRTSLAMWAKHMPIKFVEDRSQNVPDISIHFARGEHGPQSDPIFDGSPTGTLNVLAHAWGPGYNPKGLAGDVHFDEDDDWKNRSTLLGVAVHELGHAMGLGHSDDKESIMYPVYRDVVELGRDDINGIREMYRAHTGAKPGSPSTRRPDTRYPTYPPRYQTERPDPRYRTERPDPRYRTERPDPRYRTERPDPRYRTERPDPRYRTVRPDPRYRTERPNPRHRTERPDPRYRTNRPDSRYQTREPDIRVVPLNPRPGTTQSPVDICMQVNVDAVFEDPTTKLGRAYLAVLDENVHTLTQHGLLIRSQQLKSAYPEAPTNPDVVFSISKKQTVYFIKDNTMWAYRGNLLEKGYPKSLRNYRFPEHPQFSVTLYDKDGNSRLLLFGNYYWWTFDVDRSAPASYQSISSFSGDMPRGVKFASRWADNKLYAVMQDSYVIMDLDSRKITHKKPGKPEWMQALCGNAASPSLNVAGMTVLVILANIFKSVM